MELTTNDATDSNYGQDCKNEVEGGTMCCAVGMTAETSYQIALVRHRNGDDYGALCALEQAIAALPHEIGAQHALVWHLEGKLNRLLNDRVAAMNALDRVLRYAHYYPSLAPVMFGPVHHELALVYLMRHDDLLAMTHLAQAADHLRQDGQHRLLLQTLHLMAWLCLQDHDPDGADYWLDEAEPLVKGLVDSCHQRVYRSYVLTLSGEHARALRLLDKVFVDLHGDGPRSQRPSPCVSMWPGTPVFEPADSRRPGSLARKWMPRR